MKLRRQRVVCILLTITSLGFNGCGSSYSQTEKLTGEAPKSDVVPPPARNDISDWKTHQIADEVRGNDPASQFVASIWPAYWSHLEYFLENEAMSNETRYKLCLDACQICVRVGFYNTAQQVIDKVFDQEVKGEAILEYQRIQLGLSNNRWPRQRDSLRSAIQPVVRCGNIYNGPLLKLFNRQLFAGFVDDAFELANTMDTSETKCLMLMRVYDVLRFQGRDEESQAVSAEVDKLLNDPEIKFATVQIGSHWELIKSTPVVFSKDYLNELVQPWRIGEQSAATTTSDLCYYARRLRHRGDMKGIDQTLQFIEDNLLEDLSKMKPIQSGSYSSPGSAAWNRLLQLCYDIKQFDRALRLLVAIEKDNDSQLEFVAKNLSIVMTRAFRNREIPLHDNTRLLLDLKAAVKELASRLPPELAQFRGFDIALEADLLLKNDEGVRESGKPYYDSIKSPESWPLGAADIAANLVKIRSFDGLDQLLQATESRSIQHFIRAQQVHVLCKQGQLDRAVILLRSVTAPMSRSDAEGCIAAGLFQSGKNEEAEQLVMGSLGSVKSANSQRMSKSLQHSSIFPPNWRINKAIDFLESPY